MFTKITINSNFNRQLVNTVKSHVEISDMPVDLIDIFPRAKRSGEFWALV
ncbi:hypothetical protein Pla8534_33350 [Lignipirellula cremea]|uniref:Uncharacterized protein n=1 Tax=Lignipirellula cremea TaxID=2528010 RepID=A0A518DUL1_9BACT|nr:hypothetical protein Pla8534_33350 [Lignipirellula cremea]